MLPLIACIDGFEVVLEDTNGRMRPDICYNICEIIRAAGSTCAYLDSVCAPRHDSREVDTTAEAKAQGELVSQRLFPSLIYIASKLSFSLPTHGLDEAPYIFAYDIPLTDKLFQRVCTG